MRDLKSFFIDITNHGKQLFFQKSKKKKKHSFALAHVPLCSELLNLKKKKKKKKKGCDCVSRVKFGAVRVEAVET